MATASQIHIPHTRFQIRKLGKFTIVGSGHFGGKAKDLIEKQEQIERAGFLIPELSILFTTEFFTDLYARARESICRVPVTKQRIIRALVRTEFDHESMEIIRAIGEERLWRAVRSSHLTEHGGTGEFLTGFCFGMGSNYGGNCRLDAMIKKVVASSGDEDMAVLIQPVVGSQNEWGAAPDAAGLAYTTRLESTNEGKICIVEGMGTKAVMNGGDVYFFDADGNIRKTEHDLYSSVIHLVRSSDIELMYGCLSDEHEDLLLRELPIKLRTLETLVGGPQYIEFALTKDGIYCLQCADTTPLADERIDTVTGRNVLVHSMHVNGVMQKKLHDIVWTCCDEPSGQVDELDSGAKDYLLVLPSTILSGATPYERISREMVPNVGGILVFATHSEGVFIAGEHVRRGFGRVPFMIVPDGAFLDRFKKTTAEDGDWKLAKGKFLFQVDEGIGFGRLALLDPDLD
ncbi:hypothetical protein KKF81_05980 [Candidatus Micrarchaeota archaeon]|nr:hypothetical protein [Candidatus Micrarchaeota archaeon]MBU1166477.1 hypothetical protein [Candidatus Micrarchaeota archaeon]MBU1886183.1 hypothetical protein [Candidatus Micrarchaeota archaeon]